MSLTPNDYVICPVCTGDGLNTPLGSPDRPLKGSTESDECTDVTVPKPGRPPTRKGTPCASTGRKGNGTAGITH